MQLRNLALIALTALISIGYQPASQVAANSTLDSTFFSDNFDTGMFGSNWSTSTANNGVAQINNIYPHSGTQSAYLGQTISGTASSSLVLAYDLTGQTDVYLDFWARATGGYNYRRVSISGNGGATWREVLNLDSISASYSHQLIDIAGMAQANGIPLNNQFQVSFSYSTGCCTSRLASDGIAIDDVRLAQWAQEVATFPFAQDDFEASTLQQGIYPQSWNGGIAEISSLYGHSGSQSVFLGQKVNGTASATLVLALDLTGQQDVYLDFWARATGGYNYRRVSISSNGGATWTEILNLDSISTNFGHQVVDISSVAVAKGLPLNGQFQLSFSYSTGCCTNRLAGDGFVIDNLRLTRRAQTIVSYPFGPEGFEVGSFRQGFYPLSTSGGTATISGDTSHSGSKSIFLGQTSAGSASASLVLALDLTGQTNVLLDFWARSTGGYNYRRVSISSNSGATWQEILNLDAVPASFSHQVISISNIAAVKGLPLNNQFRISFDYSTGCCTSRQVGDGLVLDDIKLVPTSISGKVYNEAATTGNEVAGAYVEVCSAGGACQTVTTSSDGSYGFGDLAAGSYTLRALPPANNKHLIGSLGPVTLTSNGPLSNQNILLPRATGLPTGTSVTPSRGLVDGAPSIFWTTSVLLRQKGCSAGTATYQVLSGGAVVRSGGLAESPAGTYTAQIAPFFPIHSNVQVSITILCPNTSPQHSVFTIWIDPSGLVVNTNGQPIAGATVSLYRSEATSLADATASSFSAVPTGSAVMSPSNRTNPMSSDASGAFGWDVVAGYYKVRAEKAGCTIPGGSQAYIETGVLTIPPAVTDLRLTLYCGEQTTTRVFVPLIRR